MRGISFFLFQIRIMKSTFNGDTNIIFSFYWPTNASDNTDFITFCNELSSFVCIISKHNVLILGGDMNAQIDED